MIHIYRVHVDGHANQKRDLIGAAVTAEGSIKESYHPNNTNIAAGEIRVAYPDEDLSSPILDVPEGLERNGWGSHNDFARFFVRFPMGDDSVFVVRQPLDPAEQEEVLKALRGEDER